MADGSFRRGEVQVGELQAGRPRWRRPLRGRPLQRQLRGGSSPRRETRRCNHRWEPRLPGRPLGCWRRLEASAGGRVVRGLGPPL